MPTAAATTTTMTTAAMTADANALTAALSFLDSQHILMWCNTDI